jgi:hypothetical protein
MLLMLRKEAKRREVVQLKKRNLKLKRKMRKIKVTNQLKLDLSPHIIMQTLT